MADAVDLCPGLYEGTYKIIGGTTVLDFANLVSYRGTERQHDWLEPDENATRWAATAGLPAPHSAEVAELRIFREVLADVFLSITDGLTPDPVSVAQIGARAAEAYSRRRLLFPATAGAAEWSAPSLLERLAIEAAELLTSPAQLVRVASCLECRWLFIDSSRNGSRRWCDPADCGNRARQRRHYHRSKRVKPEGTSP